MDDEAMIVELELDGLRDVLSGLGVVATALDIIYRQLQAIKRMSTIPVKLRAVWTSAGSTQALTKSAGAAMNVYVINWPTRAVVGGSRPPRPPDPWIKKLYSAITTSRFGANGMMPLVGKVLALIPDELKGIVAAITALVSVATAAAEAIRHFRNDQLVSGATAGEAGRLRAFGDTIGVDNMGQMARQLADSLSHNDMAAAAGNRIGIHDIGNPYATDLDKAKNLEKVIDYITAATTSDAQARRFAIQTGTEELLRLRDVSRPLVDALKIQGTASGYINDNTAANDAADFWGSVSLLKSAFGDFISAVGQYILPGLTVIITAIAAVIEGLAAILKALWNFFTLKWLFGGNDEERKSRDRHTDAMEEHARVLKAGIYGGGERARGAVPGAFSGNNPSMRLNPATMGSFGL